MLHKLLILTVCSSQCNATPWFRRWFCGNTQRVDEDEIPGTTPRVSAVRPISRMPLPEPISPVDPPQVPQRRSAFMSGQPKTSLTSSVVLEDEVPAETSVLCDSWGLGRLDTLKPIFEAEIRWGDRETLEWDVERVFLQWDSDSTYRENDGHDFITVGVMQTKSGQWIRVPPSTYDTDTPYQRLSWNDMGVLYSFYGETNTIPGRVGKFPVSLPRQVWSDMGTGVNVLLKRAVYWDGTDAPWEER